MARIRSIKPEFFRHEGLQDLEIANPGMYPMLVFCGLWGHCDSKGRFEWRPRQLKLDVLPFLNFDMALTLSILEQSGMVKRYSAEGKEYGEIQSFNKHQRLSGKELTEGEKYPSEANIDSEALGKRQGSVREIPESQEGKGREEEREEVNTLVPGAAGDESSVKKIDPIPSCPQKEILSLFAEQLPDLPQPRMWEGTSNERNLRVRWRWVIQDLKAKAKPFDAAAGVDFFRRMFAYIGQSDFLCGRTSAWAGADLGWIVKAENFNKILQGNYENKAAA